MSEETKLRTDVDPAALVAQELRARLRGLPPEQVVELCAQLLNTYVVEGVLPLSRAGDAADLAADGAGEESFAQMLKRLKASRKDPVLERFLVDGENISVRIDGYGVLPITEYRRPGTPPGAPVQPRRETVPGAAGSIYNRALYQPEQAPARGPQPTPPPPAQQQQRAPQAPAQPAQPGQPARK
ncbi:MAG TPA: hypothetical protein VE964_15890, partial [Myxococcales bacterium]|nr:hypothetical protein [Myxococcales bacterium]